MRRHNTVLVAAVFWQLQAAASNTIEDVLVTAQHRQETARSTPVSLVTLNEEQLQKQRISSIDGLNGLVPNLGIDRFPANNQTLRLFIRGVGLTDTQITQDAAVGVYLNDTYIARSTGLAFDIADIERIEVLRGPQGTLYGRNTTGGAIRLITRKPSTEAFDVRQTFSTGSQNLFASNTSINLPLTERHAAKFALFYEDVDGFTDNAGPGGDWGDRRSKGLRLDFRAEMNADLTVDYGYDWSDIEYYNDAAQAVRPRPGGGDDLLAIVGNIVEDYVPYQNNRIGTLSTTVPLLPTDIDVQGHSLNVSWALTDKISLRSISAYRELSDKSYLDFASGASEGYRIDFNAALIGADAGQQRRDLAAGRPDLQQEQFSQEIQLLGSLGDSLDYIAGVYYFREKAEEDATPTRHIFSAFPFGPDGTLYNIGSEFNEIDNEALAFFSQATWTPPVLESRLHLTLGWRHSRDSREAIRVVEDEVVVDQGSFVLPLLPVSNFAANAGDDFSDDSFTFIAEFDWNDNLNLYGKYAQAYNSGGFNVRDPDEQGFSNGFDQEKLHSLELGAKGSLLSQRLTFSSAVFYQEFDDFQYNFQIPGTVQGSRVLNVDNGELSGVELEVVAMPSDGLLLQASYAYLDSKLDAIVNPESGETEFPEFNNAPEHTYSLVADYSFEAGAPVIPGTFNISASYSFVDDRQKDNPLNVRPSYSLINAQASVSDIEAFGGQLRIALWGKNLQDSDYEAFTLDNLPQAERAVIWGDGLSYGVDVTYRYR